MPKKFKFRLQPVLKYRQWIEDETRKRYLDILQIREAKELELDGLKSDTSKALAAMVDAKSGAINMHRVRVLNRYITGLKLSTVQREGELRVVEKEVDKRRDELVAARRDVKSMDKLKMRRRREHDYADERELIKDLDEMGAVSHERRKNGQERD